VKQESFFDTEPSGVNAYGYPREISPRDPSVTPVEAPRLSRQCRLILDRLKDGPVTNSELSALALKYTGRLSDLRAAGCTIDVIHRDHATGLVRYKLNHCPEGL
jgi:hypothetical protein